MKVLWLTNTPAGASEYLNVKTPGRGWIASLGDVVKNVDGIELAVCFFNNNVELFKFQHEGITYYPIKDKLSSIGKKVWAKALGKIWDSNLPHLLRAVNDFKPDIIQLFGTESGLGEIVGNTTVPVIIHLQGLLNPYCSNWLPSGFTLVSILLSSSFVDLICKRDLYHEYQLLRKLARREEQVIKKSKYFFGRTDWDRRIVNLFNTNHEYFFCDEVLRPFLYNHSWTYNQNDVVELVSVVNPQIYKGLDVVLHTAEILRSKTSLQFTWSIIGLQKANKIVRIIEKNKKLTFKENNVHFRGVKSGADLVSTLIRSNLFIHPSHIDNSPNSVCEALLLGMPVIAGSVGGVTSLVSHGFNGLCYNSHDSYDLASLILDKCFKMHELIKLGRNAREQALQRHDRSKIAGVVKVTYENILETERLANETHIDESKKIL